MYVHGPLVGAVALVVVAAVLAVFSLTGPWFTWEGEQLVKWAAGATAIGAVAGAVAQYREFEARRNWQARSERP